VIFRIFFYRFYKACTNDKYYEETFIGNHKNRHAIDSEFSDIIVNAKIDDDILTGFLTFVADIHGETPIVIHHPVQADLIKDIKIGELVVFIKSCLVLEKQVEECTKGTSSVTEDIYQDYKNICNKYIETEQLPLTREENDKLIKLERPMLNKFILKPQVVAYLSVLYYRYFEAYRRSSHFYNASKKIRERINITGRSNVLFGLVNHQVEMEEIGFD
jgi:hypothetical protein